MGKCGPGWGVGGWGIQGHLHLPRRLGDQGTASTFERMPVLEQGLCDRHHIPVDLWGGVIFDIGRDPSATSPI